MAKTFLVIEDDKHDAELVKRVFRSLDNCDAALCRNLSEAKAYLLGGGLYCDRTIYPIPNAVICDFKLAGEDATDLLKWIKSEEGLSNMPVYILTGRASPNEVNQAKKLGSADVLEKPLDFTAFKQMLTDLAAKLCGSN